MDYSTAITVAAGAKRAYDSYTAKGATSVQKSAVGGVNARQSETIRAGRRKQLDLKRLRRMWLSNHPLNIVRCDAISTDSTNEGARRLFAGGLTTADARLPIDAFEITAVPVMIPAAPGVFQGTPVLSTPSMLYEGRTSNVNTVGSVGWYQDPGVNANYAGWEKGVGSGIGWDISNFSNYKKIWIDSFDMKFQFYAVPQQPMRYTVQLVKFSQRELHPEFMRTGGDLPNRASAQNFWVEQLKPLVASPLSTNAVPNRKGMKVLLERTVVMAETLNDSDYKQRKILNIKYAVDKLYPLDWNNNIASASNVPSVPLSAFPEVGIIPQLTWNERIKPEERIYCIVKCEALSSPGPFNINLNGSYDYVIRAKYRGI